MKSLYEIEREVEKDYFAGKRKIAGLSELEISTFLFRSEDTAEWIVGAKRLGKMAAENKENALEKLKEYIENKGQNRHILRHSFLAVLMYLSEIIKLGKEEETFTFNIFKEGKPIKKCKASTLFFEMFEKFEEYAALKSFVDEKDLPVDKAYKEKLLKNLLKLKINEIEKKIEDKKKKIENTKDSKTISGMKIGLKKMEEDLSLLKKIEESEDYFKILEEVKIKERIKNIENFFKSFEDWVVESSIVGMGEFYEAIKTADNEISKKFLSLNFENIFLGILSYGMQKKIGYFKNIIYTLGRLSSEKEFNEILVFFKENYLRIVQKFTDEKAHHFMDLIIEIENYLNTVNKDSFTIENILFELNIIKSLDLVEDKFEVLKNSVFKIDEFLKSSEVIKPSVKLIRSELILLVYSVYSLKSKKDDREKVEDALISLIKRSLERNKEVLPHLLQILKVVFYEDLKKVFYHTRLKNNEATKRKVKESLITQFYVASLVEKDWNTPKLYEKEVGTILARILQTSYLFDKVFEDENFFEEMFYSLFYIIPDHNVFEEIYEYVSIKEIEDLIKNTVKILKVREESLNENRFLFKEYFDSLKDILDTRAEDIKKLFDIRNKNFFSASKGFLRDLIFYKIKYQKIGEEGLDFIKEKENRGIRLLKDYSENIINMKFFALESILKKIESFNEKIQESDSVELKDIEDMLENHIYNFLSLREWVVENIPFIESLYIKLMIEKEVKFLESLYDALVSSVEKDVLSLYTNKEYRDYHPFIEKWLSKRLLFDSIIDENLKIRKKLKEERRKKAEEHNKEKENLNDEKKKVAIPYTNFAHSKALGIFKYIYKMASEPFIVFTLVFLPFVFYILHLEKSANFFFSLIISAINILIPVSLIVYIVGALIGSINNRMKKKKRTLKYPIGIVYADFFFPNLFGLIVIAVITIIGADENWAMGLLPTATGMWKVLFFFVITYLFVRNSIVSNFEDLDEENNLIKPSLTKRIWKVLSVGIFESYFIILYMEAIYSKLMYSRAELEEVMKMSSKSVFGIPKWISLKACYLSFSNFPFKKVIIEFSPFFIITAIVSVLFAGVVLNLFLNKDKIV